MGVVEGKQRANGLWGHPVIARKPIDSLVAIDQEVLGTQARAAQHRLAAHPADHRLDQRAFCPVDVLHGPDIALQRSDVPARAETVQLSGVHPLPRDTAIAEDFASRAIARLGCAGG